MPSIIRNQQFALLSFEKPADADTVRYFSPYPIDARNEDEAQDLAIACIRSKGLVGTLTLVKLIADYKDGSGPSAIYEGRD